MLGGSPQVGEKENLRRRGVYERSVMLGQKCSETDGYGERGRAGNLVTSLVDVVHREESGRLEEGGFFAAVLAEYVVIRVRTDREWGVEGTMNPKALSPEALPAACEVVKENDKWGRRITVENRWQYAVTSFRKL